MYKKYSGIYKIKNLLTGKVYIGQSIDINTRFKQHKRNVKRNFNILIYYAIRKYGIENFEFNVIEHINDINKLNEKEQFWMDFYKSYDSAFGYNICKEATSTRGYKHTVEAKLHIGFASKGRKPIITEESRKKMSDSHKGKQWSKELRDKMIIERKERSKNPEYIKKLSDSHKGKKMSKESRKLLSNSRQGMIFTEEHKQNLSLTLKSRWQDPVYREKMKQRKTRQVVTKY